MSSSLAGQVVNKVSVSPEPEKKSFGVAREVLSAMFGRCLGAVYKQEAPSPVDAQVRGP